MWKKASKHDMWKEASFKKDPAETAFTGLYSDSEMPTLNSDNSPIDFFKHFFTEDVFYLD